MPRKNDLTGERFGRLIAIRTAGKTNGRYIWECLCDCGNTAYVVGSHLANGHTQSCGCLRIDTTSKMGYSHGLHGTRLYRIWANIKTRCNNPNAPNYKFYGGKGIAICDEWGGDFQTFYEWAMDNGYKDDLTIDRINSDLDYSPENCRWITQSENATRANMKRWAIAPAVPEGIKVTACKK